MQTGEQSGFKIRSMDIRTVHPAGHHLSPVEPFQARHGDPIFKQAVRNTGNLILRELGSLLPPKGQPCLLAQIPRRSVGGGSDANLSRLLKSSFRRESAESNRSKTRFSRHSLRPGSANREHCMVQIPLIPRSVNRTSPCSACFSIPSVKMRTAHFTRMPDKPETDLGSAISGVREGFCPIRR